MGRLRGIGALVSVVILFAATACAGSNDAGSGATGEGSVKTITLLIFGAPEELAAYRTLIKAFEAEQRTVRVQLIEAADNKDLMTRLSTAFSGGRPPDLFLMNYRSFGQFASKGAIEPMGPRLASSTAFAEPDFYPQALDAFRYDGQLQCMPQNDSSLVVYYNKKLFQEARVAEPEAGWTWAQMVEKAKELTKDTNGDATPDQFGLGIEVELIRLAPFVWSNGGRLLDDEARPTRLDLATAEGTEVLEDFLDLYRTDEVIPSEDQEKAQGLDERFMAGTMGMVVSSRRATAEFRTVEGLDWDVAPLPVYKEPANILHADGYCMSAASPQKDDAWRFVEYAIGPKGAPIISATGRTVPSLRSVANSPAFLDPNARPAHAQVFLDNIDTIRRVPSISNWPEVEDATRQILEEAMFEGGNANEVATELDIATRPIFERAGK